MQRRRLLKLGLASGAALALLGGTLAVVAPSLRAARLTEGGQALVRAIGGAFLDGVLPTSEAGRRASLDGVVERMDLLLANLPSHAQHEVGQLLAVLQSAPGRRLLAGLPHPWLEATIPQLQHALQSMRTSKVRMRRQAYQALHDLVGGAYFSDRATWAALGYPGPMPL